MLTINTDWSWHQWNHLYGTFTYDGSPVFGLASTVDRPAARQLRPQRLPRHVRLGLRQGLEAREQLPDPQGRRRLLLQRQPARRAIRPAPAPQYRATIMGPGVTPDVMWAGLAPARTTRHDASATSRSPGCTTPLQAELTLRRSSARPSASRTWRELASVCDLRATALIELPRVVEEGREQRELFRRWPAGVSVVVAEAGGRRAGLTVSSLVSVSLDAAARLDLARPLGVALRGARRGRGVGRLDPRRRPGPPRPALRAQRAAARPVGRDRRARRRPAAARRRRRLDRRRDDRPARRRRPRGLRRRGRARSSPGPGAARSSTSTGGTSPL